MENTEIIATSPAVVGDVSAGAAAGKAITVIKPGGAFWDIDAREIWRRRELLYIFVWKDLKVRYKQTLLGASWAILQPTMTAAIFTAVFGFLSKIPSDGLPYPIFCYAALLPWTYFSQAMAKASLSLVGSSNLIQKVYFPRLIIPLASVLTPVVDLFLSLSVLFVLMLWYDVALTWRFAFLPLFVTIAALTALAVGLILAPLNVRYRDIGYTIPFVIQCWMFLSPVVYPSSIVPEYLLPIYSLNPLVGVVEGFRWAVLGAASPGLAVFLPGSLMVLLLLGIGSLYFAHSERTFADVI